MNPWRPKYKPLYDAIENALATLYLAAILAAMAQIVIITI
jgi:hypothetical protein